MDTIQFLDLLNQAQDAQRDEDWERASALWARVVAANPVVARSWSALGECRLKHGEHKDAITAYREAFRLGDGLPAETACAVARCYLAAGDRPEALAWLEKASSLGLRDFTPLREDADFADLRAEQRFRDLVGDYQSTGDRVRDWQTDLTFFAGEVKRRAYRPFQHRSEAAFDADIERLKRSVSELSDTQMVVELLKILRTLGDGHARAYLPRDRNDLQQAAPLEFFAFVEGIFLVAADRRWSHLLGQQLMAIGDQPIDEVRSRLDPMMVRDNENDQWVKTTSMPYLREFAILQALGIVPDAYRADYRFRDASGAVHQVTVEGDPDLPAWKIRQAEPYPGDWLSYPETLDSPIPCYLKHRNLSYWFVVLPDGHTVYLQFNAVRNMAAESFAEFTERLFRVIDTQPVARLVIDIRFNGGGNSYLLLQFLHRLVGTPRVNRRGGLFVIIGRGTFSAAQNFASRLELDTEAVFVGEPTGSSPSFVGETNYFRLPLSGARVNVSDLRWIGTWPDDHRIWIAPTLYTPPTFGAFCQNRDEALEAILNLREELPLPRRL